MTVQSQTSRADYTGNGTTTAFTVPFYFLDNSHVQVIRTVIATGVATTLVLGTDYTLTGAGVSSGGTVTTTSAPTSAQKLSVLRNVPLTQLIHYVENDPFPAASHEKALDQLTMEVQQVNETLARSIKLSSTNTMTSTEFTVPAATRANKVLGFDSTGELSVTQELGTYRGNWATSTAYSERDLVKDSSNSNIYICLTAHTSSGSTPISSNTDSAKWALLVDAAAAGSSATAAAASASAAATSASSASTSASSASTYASNASGSASAASASASSASSSAASASTSASNAAASYTSFHNQYYGAYSSDPSTRPDGSSRTSGDLYWNTTTSAMKAWSGSAWTTAYNTGGGAALIASNNLSDLANVATALTNLGIGALGTVTPGTGVATAAAAAVNATAGFITYATYQPATGKTLIVSNSLTLAGTDGTTMTFPASNTTLAGLAIAQSFTKAQRGTATSLTSSSASIAVDASLANNFTHTLTENTQLANPSNLVAGQSGAIVFTQHASSPKTMSFASYWKFPGGTAPSLTATNSAVDVLVYYVESSTRITARMLSDVK